MEHSTKIDEALRTVLFVVKHKDGRIIRTLLQENKQSKKSFDRQVEEHKRFIAEEKYRLTLIEVKEVLKCEKCDGVGYC